MVTESRLTPGQELSSSAWAQAQADGIVAQLREQAARLRERQTSALSGKGEASAKDGSVKAVVDASGVVTSLQFAPSVFERTTPDKLARTVVATIQAAATQARAQLTESLQSLREGDAGVLAAAAQGAERLGLPRVGVPAVPRTEEDQSGQPAAWSRPVDETAGSNSGTPEPGFASKPSPVRPPEPRADDVDGGLLDERPW